jgi:hypothetical protein
METCEKKLHLFGMQMYVALMAMLLTISYLLNGAHLEYGGILQHKGCGSSFSWMMKIASFLMSQALHNK